MLRSFQIDLFWMYDRHGYFGRASRINLPIFAEDGRRSGEFPRSQMTEDAVKIL
jgi:hypothetical protein